ncbi:MAG: FAD-binding oxidoreductase [Nocardiopsaceae bacterium]|jgi:sarcosine oxidase subunit beta|nr:FAD-binding oxidoreductase [Nocardiopsaceae bacterium]
MTSSGPDLPPTAPVVIIGGGIMGVSTAYELAAAGVTGVVLLDAGALGSGSTARAAGGVRAQFSDPVNVRLGLHSLRVFETFGERFGQDIDFHQVGYLFLLDSGEDVASFREAVATQQQLGVPSRLITVAEAADLSPLISTDGLLAAAYSPADGYCSPESVVLGYATAARRLGARIIPHCPVTGIRAEAGRITAVATAAGTISAPAVVCTAGPWSRQVAEWAGVELPVTPLRRQVLVTGPVPGLPPRLPFTIDFGTSLYFHREGPGLLLGMSDPDETPGFKLTRSDAWLPGLSAALARRAPALTNAGIKTGWAGLYEVSPDHNALIGESAAVSRFLYATGFSGHGFLMGPAVGEVMRDLYLGRQPFIDVTALTADRFIASRPRPERSII